MTLPRSQALEGRPSHVPHAAQPDSWRKTEGRSSMNTDPGRPHTERIWEQRRALGRRLASLRSRSGFSQWEFAPLTGYSRSTLSDAELGRHRLRREFWQRCDEALVSDGVLTAAYDRIEALAVAVRRTARSQAQAAREEQASRRLQALLPAPSAEGLGAGDGSPDRPVPGRPVPGRPAPGGAATNGITWELTWPAGPPGMAPAVAGAAAAVPSASRIAPEGGAPDGAARDGCAPAGSVPLTAMEQCPHCHQPVTVIIVAAPPPATGSPARRPLVVRGEHVRRSSCPALIPMTARSAGRISVLSPVSGPGAPCPAWPQRFAPLPPPGAASRLRDRNRTQSFGAGCRPAAYRRDGRRSGRSSFRPLEELMGVQDISPVDSQRVLSGFVNAITRPCTRMSHRETTRCDGRRAAQIRLPRHASFRYTAVSPPATSCCPVGYMASAPIALTSGHVRYCPCHQRDRRRGHWPYPHSHRPPDRSERPHARQRRGDQGRRGAQYQPAPRRARLVHRGQRHPSDPVHGGTVMSSSVSEQSGHVCPVKA